MNRYNILLNILDNICEEADISRKMYHPSENDVEKKNQARSRAYIHLFLLVKYGIQSFDKRESLITDGPNDGGIDGYYINYDSHIVTFIQSKFRTTEYNYKNKSISLEEILMMDIDRILSGEETYANGSNYNGKILGLIRKISEIKDIGRYKYKVLFLANVNNIDETKLLKLTDNIPFEIINYDRCYSELVYPVISGNYFQAEELTISLNLSNKTRGNKIDYDVQTRYGQCNITVVFVSTIEVGKFMLKYQNSLLKYNPRSFLAIKQKSINSEIRDSIIKSSENEFALLNNGITIISEESFLNEKTGKKNEAQLLLKNPQIVNGGQTAYTLSTIYEDVLNEILKEDTFKNKEVLLRVITLDSNANQISAENKLSLIDEISIASNKQSTVDSVDRISNNKYLQDIQAKLFNTFGILIERKKGEFYSGITKNYISQESIFDRVTFMKVAFASCGYCSPPRKVKKLFDKKSFEILFEAEENLIKISHGLNLLQLLNNFNNDKDLNNLDKTIVNFGKYAFISIIVSRINKNNPDYKLQIMNLATQWNKFKEFIELLFSNKLFFEVNFSFHTKNYSIIKNYIGYFKNQNLVNDINNFFFSDGEVMKRHTSNLHSHKDLRNYIKVKHKIDLEIIFDIIPYIDTENWYDKKIMKSTADILELSLYEVKKAVRLATNKEIGKYINDEYIKYKESNSIYN